MTWQSAGGKSFEEIARETVFKGGFDRGGIDAIALALLNAAKTTIIAPGITIVSGGNSYTTQSADSLEKVAVELHFVDGKTPNVKALLDAVPTILSDPKLIAAQSILAVPPFPHKIVAVDTLQAVATQYGINLDGLASANGGVKDLFDKSRDPNLNVPHLIQYQVGALMDEMRRTLALQHMGAMASRYYLHGLRLPTRFKGSSEKLTANANGLFVKKGGEYPDNLGLFALTGQAFPLPDIPDPSTGKVTDPKFSFTLTKGSEGWLSLGSDGTSLAYILDTKNGNQDYIRYAAIKRVARGFLSTRTKRILPLQVAQKQPGRYPLSREISWQPAAAIVLPQQTVTPSTPRPRLWSLPNELINIPHGALPDGTRVHPTLRPWLSRTDQSRGITLDEKVNNYGFGTLISFTVKRMQSAEGSGCDQPHLRDHRCSRERDYLTGAAVRPAARQDGQLRSSRPVLPAEHDRKRCQGLAVRRPRWQPDGDHADEPLDGNPSAGGFQIGDGCGRPQTVQQLDRLAERVPAPPLGGEHHAPGGLLLQLRHRHRRRAQRPARPRFQRSRRGRSGGVRVV